MKEMAVSERRGEVEEIGHESARTDPMVCQMFVLG